MKDEKTFLDELTQEQKDEVLKLLFYTIKEMREEIAIRIENAAADWQVSGFNKSRKTIKAFKLSAQIARGEIQ